ncbi:MAG: threonine/serine exporter family protein [Oscillospiraceae bacterium]|nr:threonine/serine exporter family protein [Oscillospiraceae bacterium]
MRDIIFGDTNSGVNRIVQVLLVAAAIALGTGAGYRATELILSVPISPAPIAHLYEVQNIATFIACAGFSIIFNIHGWGICICALGGVLTWIIYCVSGYFGFDIYASYFFAAVIAAGYAEIMARVRKYPAISYLVVAIFPLIPGAGIYYATSYLMQGDQGGFVQKSLQTIGIAGVIAVGILMVSTLVRLWNVWKARKTQ